MVQGTHTQARGAVDGHAGLVYEGKEGCGLIHPTGPPSISASKAARSKYKGGWAVWSLVACLGLVDHYLSKGIP